MDLKPSSLSHLSCLRTQLATGPQIQQGDKGEGGASGAKPESVLVRN